MKKTIILILALLLMISMSFSVSAVYIIELTTGTWNGDLQTAGAGVDGIDGADNLCDAEFPGYKALIIGDGRNLTSDWPLLIDTEYYRSDGTTLIDTTDNNGCFTFNLNNSVIIASGNRVWSGSNANCAPSADSQCDSWTSDSGGITTRGGYAHLKTTGAWSDYGFNCGVNPSHLYCVSQPIVEEPAPIPEFSLGGLILTLLILAIGVTFIIKTRK